jgi:RimJ/RimL family protein N-acetyltransferase
VDAVARITPSPEPGDRLVLRHRLPDGTATDVLGVLIAAGPELITVRTRDDRIVEVARAAVILAKRVPSISRGPDPLRIPAEELEHAAARGWIAYAERLGAWWLRAGGGFTGRANSCLAVGDPGVPFDQAARRVVAFAAAHRIPPLTQVIADSPQEAAFRELGWTETYQPTDVMVQRMSDLGTRPADPRVVVEEQLTDAWWRAYHSYRPTDADPELLRTMLTGQPPYGLAGIADGDHLIASGRGQISQDWLGIAALWTDPAHRRQGLATSVLIALVHWAGAKGARNAYLQVAQENTNAHEAYERLGFRLHHSYRYLCPGTPA